VAPLALYTVICIHCPPKKIIAYWSRLLNYCLVYIVPTCAQISFASFNGFEQFFYWLQNKWKTMQYTLIRQLMKVFGGRSHATIHAHNKPKLTYTKMRSQRMSAHSFSESDEGLITILHNYSIYKINEVTVLPYKVKSLLLHT